MEIGIFVKLTYRKQQFYYETGINIYKQFLIDENNY